MINFPPAAILILGAVVLAVLPRRIRSAAFLVFPVLAFLWLLQLNPGDSQTINFLNYALIPTRIDELSLAFGYVFVIITFLGGIYGYHLKDTAEQVSTLFYAGSSLGVVFAGDLFTLVFFWEIMAVSSLYLIWARKTPGARAAGMRYLMVHLFGGSLLLGGVLVHVTTTGSIIFNAMDASISSYLILSGFCLNAAVPPLHAWLSDAYPEGTVTGSVYLSVFTTKTAVYVLARGFAGWEVLLWAGAAMTVYGVVFAVLQNDIRRLLSYHIISQVGYMVAGVGLGTAIAIDGATAHAINNILYKTLLFMGAGAVLYTTGKSKMTELGGLAKAMPWVLVLYMVGAFSISGVPLFSGFVSKSMVIFAAGDSGMGLAVILLTLASVGTFLSVGLKLPYYTWFGQKSSVAPKDTPPGMYLGMALTAAMCVAIGVYPALLYNILPYPVDYQPYTPGHIIETIQLLIFTAVGFWILVKLIKPKADIALDIDWFYRRPARLAYTVFVVSISRFFADVEVIVLKLVQFFTRVGVNPVSYLAATLKLTRENGIIMNQTDPVKGYDPDWQRLSVEPMVLIVILIFIVLIAWGLFQIIIYS